MRNGSPTPQQSLKVPQLNGLPGWLLLTRRPSSEAVALSIDDKGGHQEELTVVMDERMCSDTMPFVFNSEAAAASDCSACFHSLPRHGNRHLRIWIQI